MEKDRQLRESLRRKNPEEAPSLSDVVVGDTMGQTETQEDGGDSRWPGTKPEGQVPLSLEKVAAFEEAFGKIKDATGIQDIHELVEKFLQAEDKNFRLFNFVNHTNSEIERLEVIIADTKAEIEKHKGQGVSTDTQRKKILRDLEDRLARTEKKADEYDKKHANAMKTINQLKTGIHSIFTRLGCNSSSVEEMLGNQGVTESNMMQYLGIIEMRTSEILQMYAASQANMAGTDSVVHSIQNGIVQPAAPPAECDAPRHGKNFRSGKENGCGRTMKRPPDKKRNSPKKNSLGGIGEKKGKPSPLEKGTRKWGQGAFDGGKKEGAV
eukprot:FR743215.1.p1 GENE.FR743215.1~~FR743215.1.p1  ORF type:complete len:324 (+),score=82.55 FR743215.1:110-1081(+)